MWYSSVVLRKRFAFFGSDDATLDFFDGNFYCSNCHQGQVAVIPRDIIECWDFTPKPGWLLVPSLPLVFEISFSNIFPLQCLSLRKSSLTPSRLTR